MASVLISGGTGLVGSYLSKYLVDKGFEVIIFTRRKRLSSDNPKITYSYWNVKEKIIDGYVVRNANHIVHLAGAGIVDKKWTAEYQKIIIESRTKSAELILDCLKDNQHHVKTFVSASAIGWYGEDGRTDESKDGFVETDLPSSDFLGETCVAWEASTEPATSLGIRLVKLRSGIVLSNKGGELAEFETPLKFGIAPILGSGKQVVSWIHIADLCRMYTEAIENPYLHGSYNAVAPKPVTQRELIMTLGQKFRNRFFIPVYVPSFVLKLMFGKRSIEILKSATVSNKKIKSTGFTFLFPSIESAIEDLKAHPEK
ncbi:MAG TPA: TIGR01777 family oxidoreductase [Hanamia sp.]|nr:TIGR01777 family oxidoreductase [Hanamia sp.]